MNMISVTTNVCSLLFCIFLVFVYFSKKNMPNIENKVYRVLLISNMLILTAHLLFLFFQYYLYEYEFIIGLSMKFYYIFEIIWYMSFFYYTILVINENNEKMNSLLHKKNNKIYSFIVGVVVISSIIVLILPIKLTFNEFHIVVGYEDSLCSYFVSVVLYSLLPIAIISIIKNIKNIQKKKIAPFFVLIILTIFTSVVAYYEPTICIYTLSTTLISYLMYHTIENPDLKLIKSLEEAKKQAEKSKYQAELAKIQAEKANRAKTDFLSSMSHEIRTPLNAIVGLSEVILSNDDINEIHEDAQDVVKASQNLLEIVDGILDIGKIETEKMEIVETNYKLVDVLDELVRLVSVRIGERPIEIRTHFSSNIPDNLYGDKRKIRQIITNLLTNAEKYTDSGYIDFSVNCINEPDVCKLQIVVSDTGRGMKQEQINTLFTKFNRLEEDINSAIEGTGLGLAITKALVEMMGGRIAVESEYGKGSKFTVFIIQRLAHKDFEDDKQFEKQIIINFPGRKVLVVDDNKLNLKVATKLLNEFKFDIECVESGYECIDKVQTMKYDMIFMDIMMPKMDGVETLNKLKELNGFNTPVIALTADAMQGTYTKYIEAGFDDYLSKPIDRDLLKKVLNKFLIGNNVEKTNMAEQTNVIETININNEVSINNLQSDSVNNDSQVIDNKKGNVNYLKENNVDIEASLELLGDIEMYNETLQTFIEENKARIPRIEKNRQEGNMKDYSVDVHALKSDCKYLGFKTLAELAYNHEMKSKENDINYVNEHYNELINEYNRINNIISEYM